MKSLEEYILTDYLAAKELKLLEAIELVTDGDEIYIKYLIEDKPKKLNISKKIWAPLKEMYETYVATTLLKEGYLLCPIEGGFLVKGGEDIYQIHEDTCTCPHYIYTKKRCQHLVFRDWHLNYRAKCSLAVYNL